MPKVEILRVKDSTGRMTGFSVSFYKKATVHIHKHQLVITFDKTYEETLALDRTSGSWATRLVMANPWSYYSICEDVIKYVCSGWESKKPIPLSKWQEWKHNTIGKKYGKRIHAMWLELLANMDQKWLAVSRAMFSANFGQRIRAGIDFITQAQQRNIDDYLLKDIITYKPAAMMAHNRPDLIFELSDWMRYFNPTAMVNTTLRKTLAAVPNNIPWGIISGLSNFELERPLRSKTELVATCAVSQHNNRHLTTVMRSDKNRIKQVGHDLHTNNNGMFNRGNFSVRRTRDIMTAITYVADYPDDYRGSLEGLKNRSVRWHNALHEDRRNRRYTDWMPTTAIPPEEPDSLELPRPSQLPDVAGITFIDTAGRLRQEGKDMHHCVGGYVGRALKGHFFFHIEHEGHKATAQVAPDGSIYQCHGPCNRKNDAVTWGRKQLHKWAKDIGLYQPVKYELFKEQPYRMMPANADAVIDPEVVEQARHRIRRNFENELARHVL